MSKGFSQNFRIKNKFSIKKTPTGYQGKIDKRGALAILEEEKAKLYQLQEKLYADGSQSLLIVIQAMDAAGKDSLIQHVMSGINPQGCEVTSFKTPSSKEYNHDFLWRHYKALPDKGKIGIFNRSHYESVLICKVHPEFNLHEHVWKDIKQIDTTFWQNRYESIRNFEKHLVQNGTHIVKFFLHVSKKEQKKRLLARINKADKNWKFSENDLKERLLWDDYQKAYEEAINETSTADAPWYVLPADQKWFTRIAACQIIIDTLKHIDPKFPRLGEDTLLNLQTYKNLLIK
ncbi:polyphosphate kinase 2 family protein [Elizabethkingia argentiflava]|uniref:Polyphosphate kinase 2 family protein n=1 Tax=Elizabethkingia argenteiflava TaxID=2681556 RepID=A0A845PU17_9FLAO|nr:PPK2 family polyphosphate kinase [Elizabethkingia argenteiflava]NAW51314.1 polyphosphate kinase 2 family protein [Elizabethkingia argenteiflava]